MNIQKTVKFLNTNRLLWPLKIAMTVLVIYLVNKSVGKNQMPRLFQCMSFGPVALGVLLGCAELLLQTKRWQILLHIQGTTIDFKTGLRTMLWGCLLAFVTPGRSGEFLRGISIPARGKADPVFAVLIDKICSAIAALFFGAIAAVVSYRALPAHFLPQQSIVVWATAALAIAAAIVPFCKPAKAMIAAFFRSRPSLDFFMSVKPAGATSASLVLVSVAAHLILLAPTAVLLDMFGSGGLAIGISVAAQAYAFMLFLPIFIANMGLREYSFGLFLGQLSPGLGPMARISSIAFGASLCILCINIVLPALAGLLWWLGERKKAL
jgi:Lysylphosphatidylglycerol synthase TM region